MCKQKKLSGGAVGQKENCMGDKEWTAYKTGYCFFSIEENEGCLWSEEPLEEAEQATVRLRGQEIIKSLGIIKRSLLFLWDRGKEECEKDI